VEKSSLGYFGGSIDTSEIIIVLIRNWHLLFDSSLLQ
jgi:hypothetical protein